MNHIDPTGPRHRAQARLSAPVLALLLLMSARVAVAAPLALLDRAGSQVSIESYAPNIVRITISLEKDLALAPAGFGALLRFVLAAGVSHDRQAG